MTPEEAEILKQVAASEGGLRPGQIVLAGLETARLRTLCLKLVMEGRVHVGDDWKMRIPRPQPLPVPFVVEIGGHGEQKREVVPLLLDTAPVDELERVRQALTLDMNAIDIEIAKRPVGPGHDEWVRRKERVQKLKGRQCYQIIQAIKSRKAAADRLRQAIGQESKADNRAANEEHHFRYYRLRHLVARLRPLVDPEVFKRMYEEANQAATDKVPVYGGVDE